MRRFVVFVASGGRHTRCAVVTGVQTCALPVCLEVPRVYLMDVGEHWKVNSQNVEVIQKKRIFFRTLGPLVLRANEKILADRERLLALQAKDDAGGEDATWLTKLAQRYKVEGDRKSVV